MNIYPKLKDFHLRTSDFSRIFENFQRGLIIHVKTNITKQVVVNMQEISHGPLGGRVSRVSAHLVDEVLIGVHERRVIGRCVNSVQRLGPRRAISSIKVLKF